LLSYISYSFTNFFANYLGTSNTTPRTPRSKKRQLSDLCDETINEPTEQEPTEQKPKRSYNRRGRGGKR